MIADEEGLQLHDHGDLRTDAALPGDGYSSHLPAALTEALFA